MWKEAERRAVSFARGEEEAVDFAEVMESARTQLEKTVIA